MDINFAKICYAPRSRCGIKGFAPHFSSNLRLLVLLGFHSELRCYLLAFCSVGIFARVLASQLLIRYNANRFPKVFAKGVCNCLRGSAANERQLRRINLQTVLQQFRIVLSLIKKITIKLELSGTKFYKAKAKANVVDVKNFVTPI